MKKVSLIWFIIIFIVSSSLSSCEELFDCLWSVKAELPKSRSLKPGSVNVEYNETITASAKNSPRDGDFDYSFDIDEGNLPEGLSYRIDNRVITIFGTPTKSGTYTFLVSVTLTNPDSIDYDQLPFKNDRVCFDSSLKTEEYTITISK